MTHKSSYAEVYATVIKTHREWLQDFEAKRFKKWEQRLKDSPEGAIVEAFGRKLLSQHVDSVLPAEDVATGGPDFLCSRAGKRFYVEVTCLSETTVTRKTGIAPDLTRRGRRYYSPLTRAAFQKCVKKASQVRNLEFPCLLLIGTLHIPAACLCFHPSKLEEILVGKSHISWWIDKRSGSTIGELKQCTDLNQSAFLRPHDKSNPRSGFARGSISGILFCGFGSLQPIVIGVLHPNPALPFDRDLLPRITFGEVIIDEAQSVLRVKWTKGNDRNPTERERHEKNSGGHDT